jgi:hypothetical protein
MKLTFLINVDLDHSQLETYARSQQTSLATATASLVAESEQRLQGCLKGPAVLAVTVRTLFESDRARKLVGA